MYGEKYPAIQMSEDIWKFLRIGTITLFSHDEQYYAMANGSCEWEQEHGLEIDVNEFNQVLYVGSFISNGFHENPENPSTYNYVKSGA
nr:hypothetical protein [Thaumasiovibrio subtropicus]